jgi:YVTN family beta-propeller protein
LVIKPTQSDPLASTYTLEARKGAEAPTSTISIIWTGQEREAPGIGSGLRAPAQCHSFVLLGPHQQQRHSSRSHNTGEPSRVTLPRPKPGVDRGIARQRPRLRESIGVRQANTQGLRCGYFYRRWSRGKHPERRRHSGVTPDNKRIYVTGGSELRVIDASNMQQAGQITFLGGFPQGIAFTPDGSRAFIAISNGLVSVIDTAKIVQIATIAVGLNPLEVDPVDVAVTPDGKQLYVANVESQSVSVFDAVTFTELPGSPIAFLASPFQIKPSRSGKLMFVLTVQASRRLYVIDTTTRTVVGSATAGYEPVGLAVSPDGIRVYVMLRGDNLICMYLPSATGGIG